MFYNQVLTINPRHPDALHLLGLVTLQSGDAAKTVALIRQAAALQPKNWAFQANLATAMTEAEQIDEAFTAFKRAARLNPDEPQPQMGMANCHALRGQHAAAEIQLRKVVKRFPAFALAWFNLGNAVRDQGRAEEAENLYRRALQLDPALADAHNNLGNTLQALGRLDEAEQAYRKALEIKPDYAMLHCNLASILIDRGRFVEAEAQCRRAIALAPAFATAYSFLGAAIEHQGRLQEAIEYHRKAAALDPDNACSLIALQRNPQPGEIEQLSSCLGRPVHDLTALNEDLEAMLALIDDYIGVSNTNMHLRAGVGKTARVLVPCPAEWRWMAAGEESPWFPGFRIYRQTPDGDWSGALNKLRGDLLESQSKGVSGEW